MGKGDKVTVQGYEFKLSDFEKIKGANFDATQATMDISRNGVPVATLHPEKRQYVISQMPMTEAAIHYNPLRDVYVALGEPLENSDTANTSAAMNSDKWAVRIYVKPAVLWTWWGSFVVALGGFLAMIDKRYLKLENSKITNNKMTHQD